PAEFAFRLLRVSNKKINPGWPVKSRIHTYKGTTGFAINSNFVLVLAFPLQIESSGRTGHRDEITDRRSTISSKNISIRLVCLQHAPHTFRIFLCKTPVALGVKVAEFQSIKLVQLDLGNAI